jgi:hypothetical protein
MSAQQVARGSEIGESICKVIGLDPNLVRDMTITIPADGFIILRATVNVTVEQAQVIKQELETKKIAVNIFCEKK